MIFIYLAKPCLTCASADIYPEERAEYIENTANAKVRLLRYSAWKLLERAVRDCFDLSLQELVFSVNKYGKWECDKLHFSLSHTDGLVAVALSDCLVGVDTESYSEFEKRCEKSPVFRSSLARRILHSGENVSSNAELVKLWTQKESIFKYRGGEDFEFNAFVASEYPVFSLDYGDFCISVCGSFADKSEVKFFVCGEQGGEYFQGERIIMN